MDFTGERYVPESFNESDHMSGMHLNRYKFTIPFAHNKKVLDIACGEGYGVKMLADIAEAVMGIDIDRETIYHAINKYRQNNIDFQVGSVDKIEQPDQSFDLVISFETIEHVDHVTQKIFLREVERILKPGGLFIISTPDKDVGGEGHNTFHVHELNKAALTRMLYKEFAEVELYGQDIKPYGNRILLVIARVLHKLVKLDKHKLRHKIFPKKFRLKLDTSVSNSAVNKNLTEKDIFTLRKIATDETAAFLIAVCKKQ